MDIHTANTLLDLEFMLIGEDDSANGVMPVDTVELSGALKRAYQLGQQAQHAKTWAMAIEAASKSVWDMPSGYEPYYEREVLARGHASYIRHLPCPPLEMGE